MTSRDTARIHADRIHDDATVIRARIDLAWSALQAAQPGIRSTPTDTGSHTGSISDPTAAAAGAYAADEAVQARRAVVQRLRRIDRDIAALRTLIASWAATATPPAQAPDLWCQACDRHGDTHPHDRYRIGALIVCRWARDFHRDAGRLPTHAETTHHATGQRRRTG